MRSCSRLCHGAAMAATAGLKQSRKAPTKQSLPPRMSPHYAAAAMKYFANLAQSSGLRWLRLRGVITITRLVSSGCIYVGRKFQRTLLIALRDPQCRSLVRA